MPGIYSVYIISKSGGLIFHHDVERNFASTEVEKTFSYPLDIKCQYNNQRVGVVFGQRDGIRVGYSLVAVNGEPVVSGKVGDADVVNDILPNESNYPISLKFALPRLTTNEKIVLASMFHSLYAIAALQICPSGKSERGKNKSMMGGRDGEMGSKKSKGGGGSGIQVMETDNFRLNCFQTQTGVKFMVLSDLNFNVAREALLKKIYEIYTDFALKNPFYSLDMPIRCELFESNLQAILEQNEKYPTVNNI